MKQFTIKSDFPSAGSNSSFIELIGETEGGFYIRIVRRHEDWEDVTEDFMSQELFDTCLRTGYIEALSA